ncbi:hypothetical protein PanWU01x14_332310 [Parasponia andersonii]|uniref:Uncharacterized protein n=1 Tax=Parasponia andersonii TaxID=3476 RepID=A0A2P5AHD2_PARAD|nr:hypothetical protein PanWU01x14_332310 [Parasponia andersonii]
MGGDDEEGDEACVVHEGQLEVVVHGDPAEEEPHGHAEDQVAVVLRGAAAGVDDDGDDLVVEDQASCP